MNHTVLLIDDEANVLFGLVRVLRNQPYQILTAHGADEAMHVLKTRDVDLVVTDENMPGMCGTEFLTWVAENYPQTVRIILTGNANVPMALRAINEGRVYRFLTKPCRELDLSLAISKALEYRDRMRENPGLNPTGEPTFDSLAAASTAPAIDD